MSDHLTEAPDAPPDCREDAEMPYLRETCWQLGWEAGYGAAIAAERQAREQAEQERDRLREVLLAVEWQPDGQFTEDGREALWCPWCGSSPDAGHTATCLRQAALSPQDGQR
jgi:hypothetical protein